MATFEFYKMIRTDSDKPKNACSKLHNLYNKIPDTEGCMTNIDKEDGCKGWCCKYQSPQLLYSEFLNLWHSVMKDWDIEDICGIIDKSLKNYVMGMTTKGCVFFDARNKMCRVHAKRPYNCRIYGITPKEEFQPRYERAKEMYKDVLDAIVKDQCNLIKTVDGTEITTKDTDKWWNVLVEIEKGIGIRKENVNDDMGGSYRTPHDHVLLYMLPDEIMQKLQEIRFIDNYSEKEEIIAKYMNAVRRSLIPDE